MNLRRGWWILGIVAVAALLAAGPAVASDGYFSNADGELTSSDLVTYTASGHGGPADPSPRTPGYCDTGVIGYLEYLYMGAKRDGLDVATVGDFWAANANVSTVEAQLGRDSGFRIGVGYQFANCWDATWNYTYFYTDGATLLTATAADPVSTTQVMGAGNALLETAGDFAFASSLKYQVNDLEFGRWINLDDSAAIRLFGGFRWAIIDQQLAQAWTGVAGGWGAGGTGASLGTVNMDGYGLRLGSEGRLNLPSGISLFGKGSASVLSGHFQYNVAEVNVDGGGAVTTLVATEATTQAVPVLEAAMGVAWTRNQLEVSLGYELSAWFNMGNRYTLGGPPVSNNLLMDGLFVRAAFTR